MRQSARRGLVSACVLCAIVQLAACTWNRESEPQARATQLAAHAPRPKPTSVEPVPTAHLATDPVIARDEPTPTAELPELDAEIARAIQAHKLPGAVVAIGNRNGLSFLKAYGDRALEPAREAMSVDTVFDLASLSKPVATATVLMQLVERGKIHLDHSASEYLPELRANGHSTITVRDLLVHGAGLPIENPISDYDSGRERALKKLFAQPQLTPPGQRFKYSDVGYLILGALIERVTGESLDATAERELFVPLDMRDTHFGVTQASLARVAPTERADEVRTRIDPSVTLNAVIRGTVHDPRAFRLGGVAGNAGVFSTARDLARYARMLLLRGALDGSRVLRAESVDAMTKPVFIEGAVRNLGWDMRSPYSLLRGSSLSPRAYGHGGFTGVSLWIDPGLDLFVVFLSNRVHPAGDGNVLRLAGTVADIAAAHFGRAPEPAGCARLVDQVQLGIDVLRTDGFAQLAGKRIALVVNNSSRARDGTPTLEVLRSASNVTVSVLFAPEHGLQSAREGRIADGIDARSGVPVYSLFGKTRKPTAEMLAGVDAIVFDLQDVGVRFYTYMSTLRQLLQAAAEQHIEVIVLDRPNPLGAFVVEGPVLDRDKETFVNFHPLPVRHGMTAGELARLINAERRIGAKLSVIEMRGYARELSFAHTGAPWSAPSPNLPTAESALLYPATGLLESANISVGRGTPQPFAWIGAPWLRSAALLEALATQALPGVEITAHDFTPERDRFAGQPCHGIALRVTDAAAFRAVHTGLVLAQALITTHSGAFRGADVERMLGNASVMSALLTGKDVAEIERIAEPEIMRFEARRKPHLLYASCDDSL